MGIFSALLGEILGIPPLDAAHTTHVKYVQAPQAPCKSLHDQYCLIEDTLIKASIYTPIQSIHVFIDRQPDQSTRYQVTRTTSLSNPLLRATPSGIPSILPRYMES